MQARNTLASWCDNGGKVGGRNSYVAKVGSAWTYICNSATSAQPCSSAEFDHFNGMEDDQCGDWKGAFSWISAWQKTYGRTQASAHICN